MLKRERQEFIIHQLRLHNKVLSADLSQKMSVSEDTIRRDLQELADMGKIIKVHGGALAPSFRPVLQSHDIYSLEKKQVIAQKAVRLLRDGMFVFSGGGSTVVELARSLPEGLRATFITASLPVAFEYLRHPGIEVIFIGDRISRTAQMAVGGDALNRIRSFNADLCILGTNALDLHHGLTDNDLEVAQVKRAMIERSARVVSLSIAEKIGTVQNIQVCPLERINTLITELPPADPRLRFFREAGCNVL
ncbi:DeoR/GlpR transcriptional regulator [Flaviaesturariibacter flavus]|uniref:DeoR/GlpR transcriptional regulator n=1 Tax=Flaviaesturariibacter flavus TaxID=2502780 RepID=A0A4R1BJY7_9BACT|nr:DeoR/GlpR family DNA-binding transcription regulator [Flaviaesturariibacter flavus]TCJ17518.1 DeoR/GlpR transcriptional regulator [Flaviaesturariibacter flavus]